MGSEASSLSQPVGATRGIFQGPRAIYQIEEPKATKPQWKSCLIGCLDVALSGSAMDCNSPENPGPPG